MGHEDLRITRTKQLIKSAFLELIDEHGFEAVTVKAITERAGINRGTFYSHYVDKFDLMEKSIEAIFHEAELKLVKNLPHVFGEERGESSYQLLVPFIRFIEDNKILMKPLLRRSIVPRQSYSTRRRRSCRPIISCPIFPRPIWGSFTNGCTTTDPKRPRTSPALSIRSRSKGRSSRVVSVHIETFTVPSCTLIFG